MAILTTTYWIILLCPRWAGSHLDRDCWVMHISYPSKGKPPVSILKMDLRSLQGRQEKLWGRGRARIRSLACLSCHRLKIFSHHWESQNCSQRQPTVFWRHLVKDVKGRSHAWPLACFSSPRACTAPHIHLPTLFTQEICSFFFFTLLPLLSWILLCRSDRLTEVCLPPECWD